MLCLFSYYSNRVDRRMEKNLAAKKKKRRKVTRSQRRFRRFLKMGSLMLILILFIIYFLSFINNDMAIRNDGYPEATVDLLTVNPYSRPGTKRGKIKGVVIHYVANPGSTAKQNRDYFEQLKDTKERSASSHYIIGLDGEIIQCIPLKEVAYAATVRNRDTISIEVCHNDETGKFNQKSYDSVIRLTAWICEKYNIKTKNVIRHYDVSGKNCPKYYVEHEDAWSDLKKDIREYIKNNGE